MKSGLLILLLMALTFSGCRTTPPLEKIPSPIPETWSTIPSPPSGAVSPGWIKDFNDPQLIDLVEEALEHNLEIHGAKARVNRSKALLRQAGAGRLPEDNLKFFADRLQREGNQGGQSAGSTETFGLSLDISWELDLWKKLSRRQKSAAKSFEATEADLAALHLAVAGQTIKTWYQAKTSLRQMKLAEETRDNFRKNLILIQGRFDQGLGDSLDIHLLRANLETAESNIARRSRELDLALRSLEVILGRYPSKELSITTHFHSDLLPVPAGLPSELLERRPDLIAQRKRLESAKYTFQESHSALFPRIQLTASGGTRSSELADILSTDALLWQLAGNLTSPLFNREGLQGRFDESQATFEEQSAVYAGKILQAFKEVEYTLAAESFWKNQEKALQAATKEARSAKTTAWERYTRGITNIVTVLTTERRAFETESQLLDVARERLNNQVDLHLALGGDLQIQNSSY